ncbi:MAG TPA: FAD-dependent oxidoreductase [Acidimicrobiales bacterium]|nr:FAD-dependent oxidoreductase [Acidimicrobiales bacterium]
MDVDVAVVGAGLGGLTTAHRLHAAGLSVRVIEARGRLGGRLLTIAPEGAVDHGWLDLGATWFWDDQPHLRALVEETGLATFPQFALGRALVEESRDAPPAPVDLPPPVPAERRLVGGAQPLAEQLADGLPDDTVAYAQSVTTIEQRDGGVALTVADASGRSSEVHARFAVVAVPPRLAQQEITFSPALPDELVGVMRATPTWMGSAIKCVAVYESPFWRDAGLSGRAFSEVGPLREVHDACTDDGEVAALWGFVSPLDAFRQIGPGERAEQALDQLARFFGPGAADPVQYVERDWSGDPNTNDEVWWVEGELLDYGHPALGRPLLGGRLVWAGAETVAEGGGHMEGAVRSGHRAARLVLRAASGHS